MRWTRERAGCHHLANRGCSLSDAIRQFDELLQERLTRAQRLLAGAVVWTTLMEALSLFNRFVLGLESTRDTAALAPYLFGIRIHHGYVALLVMMWAWRSSTLTQRVLLGMSLGGVGSDMLHHVLLQLITGDGDWDLFYPS